MYKQLLLQSKAEFLYDKSVLLNLTLFIISYYTYIDQLKVVMVTNSTELIHL